MFASKGVLRKEDRKYIINARIASFQDHLSTKKEHFNDNLPSFKTSWDPRKLAKKPELYRLTSQDLYLEGQNKSRNVIGDGRSCSMTDNPLLGKGNEKYPMKNHGMDLGVNPRIFVPPVIAPRLGSSTDGFNYPVSQPTNFNPVKDITDIDMSAQPIADQYTRARKIPEKRINKQRESTREGFVDYLEVSEDETKGSSGTPQQRLYSGVDRILSERFSDGERDITLEPSGEIYLDEFDEVTDTNGNNALPQAQLLPRKGETSNKNIKDPKYRFLINQTPIKAQSERYFLEPNNQTFITDVEPGVFSYTNQQTPINANLGITSTPQLPPRKYDRMITPVGNYPMYSRIDPQLIRNDLMPGQEVEQPTRNRFSEETFEEEAGPGTINYENIYDPRWTGNGDSYRSYSDVNMGQVQYYYSDIDAYTRPNFIIRNKVSHIDFKDVNGKVSPYYLRDVSLDDLKEQVEDEFLSQSISHREDLMEKQMRKKNSELWQLRSAPLIRSSNNSVIPQ